MLVYFNFFRLYFSNKSKFQNFIFLLRHTLKIATTVHVLLKDTEIQLWLVTIYMIFNFLLLIILKRVHVRLKLKVWIKKFTLHFCRIIVFSCTSYIIVLKVLWSLEALHDTSLLRTQNKNSLLLIAQTRLPQIPPKSKNFYLEVKCPVHWNSRYRESTVP